MANAPLAGTTALYQTSPPPYAPHPGAGIPAVPVAQDVELAVGTHAALTGSATAPQGLSLTGGGGVGEHVMLSVPQSPALATQGFAAWLNTRM